MKESARTGESFRPALEARDREELLGIFQELNKASKREEQIRRDVRGHESKNSAPAKPDLANRRKSNDTRGCIQHPALDTANTDERNKSSLRRESP